MKSEKALLRAGATVLLTLAYSLAMAADKPASGAVIGAGGFSCGLFSQYDRAPNNQGQMDIVVQWAWGFMSAYNNRNLFSPTYQRHTAKPITPPDSPTVLLFIRSYCEQSPLSNVTNATLNLIQTLGGSVSGTISFRQQQE
jgi:hypothetical protein